MFSFLPAAGRGYTCIPMIMKIFCLEFRHFLNKPAHRQSVPAHVLLFTA